MQSAIVFGLDNEPILEINAPSFASQSSSSIFLNLLAWVVTNKRKYKRLAITSKVSKDFLLLANSFKNSTKELVQALILSNTLSASVTAILELLSTLSRVRTKKQISMATQTFDRKITSIKACLIKIQSLIKV